MRALRGIAILVSAAVLAVPLGGCGKSKPKIPVSNAHELNTLLRQVESRTKAKKCATVPRLLAELKARVDALPPKTDPDIRGTLSDGVGNLQNLVTIQCSTVKPTPPPQTQTQTQTQPPPTTTTTTQSTPSTSTTTQSTGSTQTKPHTSPQTQPNTSGGSPSGGNGGGGLGGNGAGK